MRAFIYLIASFAAAFVLLSLVFGTTHASAATALWEDQDTWMIYGDTEHNSCSASGAYDTGHTLSIVFMDEKASLLISGLSVNQGTTYPTIVAASTGDKGVFNFYAIDNETIGVSEMNEVAVKALMNAEQLFIKGITTFDLTGSKRAMASAWECYQTLNSF